MKSHQDLGVALKFSPFISGRDARSLRLRNRLVSPYKLALGAMDVVSINLAVLLYFWVDGSFTTSWNDLRQLAVVIVASFVVLSFFPGFYLYDYHLIFSKKGHLKRVSRSLCLGLLTFGITISIYMWPGLMLGQGALMAVFLCAIGLMLLSRFLGDQIIIVVKCTGVSFLAVGSIALLLGNEVPIIFVNLKQLVVGYSFGLAAVLIERYLLVHVIFNKLLRRHFRRQVVIVGSDEEAKRLASYVVGQNAPVWISGIVSERSRAGLDAIVHKEWLGELKDLPIIVGREKIDEIFVSDENIDKRTLISLLDFCTTVGITVWFPPKMLPIIDIKLYIDSFCGLPAIRMCSQKNDWFFNKIKYGLDALISLPTVLILLPLFFVVGIAIKLTSPGGLLYKAKAIGKGGNEFMLYKFRSMKVGNTCDIHREYVKRLINGEIRDEGNKDKVFKIADDPRITAVGRFLRKFSIDELPQIFNVLKGDMSLVGARPCLPYEYEAYQDWHKKRLCFRPGITGLWQVAGRSAVSFEDMVLLDLYYIYNRSLLMDMSIIYETLYAVLGKRGAH